MSLPEGDESPDESGVEQPARSRMPIIKNKHKIAILFNAVELIFKSFRENYEENFNQDIAVLTEAGLLTADEKDFFDNPQYGIRKIRNIMTHREAYQYCLEDSNGKALPFIETDTWMLLYENYSERIVDILYNALIRSKLLDS